MKILVWCLPALALASSGGTDYDIVARTINFVIFAGILYYFLANPIKNAYKGRIESIENRLSQSRKKILAAQEKEEAAKAQVENAKKGAANLIEAGREEVRILKEKIQKDTESTLKALDESNAEQKEFARRASLKKTVESVLNESFEDENIKISEQGLVDLITKKVS